MPRDGLRAAVLLAARPRHAVGADVAALAVGVDGAAEDVAELAVLAVPAEVAAVLALAAHGARGDLVTGDLVSAVGGGGAEDGGEEQEEAGGGGHGAGVRGVTAIKSLSALGSCGSALPATTAPLCFVNTTHKHWAAGVGVTRVTAWDVPHFTWYKGPSIAWALRYLGFRFILLRT